MKKEHLKNIPKAVKEKDLKLPPLPEAPDFDTWKDKVYHKIVTAAQRGSSSSSSSSVSMSMDMPL